MVENPYRITSTPARFFMVDGRAGMFFPIVLLKLGVGTILMFIGILVVLWLIERRGYSVPVALRVLRRGAGRLLYRGALVTRMRLWRFRYEGFGRL